MYRVHCTLYSVQRTAYDVQCTHVHALSWVCFNLDWRLLFSWHRELEQWPAGSDYSLDDTSRITLNLSTERTYARTHTRTHAHIRERTHVCIHVRTNSRQHALKQVAAVHPAMMQAWSPPPLPNNIVDIYYDHVTDVVWVSGFTLTGFIHLNTCISLYGSVVCVWPIM